MTSFAFNNVPRIIVQDDSSSVLPGLVSELGITHLLLVTDSFLSQSGLLSPIIQSLDDARVRLTIFDGVIPDPSESVILECVQLAKSVRVDGVIGVGGGSSLDTAKLVALLAGGMEDICQIYGVERSKGPRLPLIQVPTTAGTGSEVTDVAIVTTPEDQKVGVVSRYLFADVAVLDPVMTCGLPAHVTAMTGLDAMVHAIEAYTCRLRKNPISDSLATQSLALLAANIDQAVLHGSDLKARRAMLLGSLLAGMAFANAPVGAVHALAYPLGSIFHVPHGLSNALVLDQVLEFNRSAAEREYAQLYRVLNPEAPVCSETVASKKFIQYMRDLVGRMPIPRALDEVGIKRSDLDRLARGAMKVDRLLVNNPREMTYADALSIYETCFTAGDT